MIATSTYRTDVTEDFVYVANLLCSGEDQPKVIVKGHLIIGKVLTHIKVTKHTEINGENKFNAYIAASVLVYFALNGQLIYFCFVKYIELLILKFSMRPHNECIGALTCITAYVF